MAKKGEHLSEETRRKLSEWNKGKHHTEEARKKMSEARPASVWGATSSTKEANR
jgi:hypothetical protein